MPDAATKMAAEAWSALEGAPGHLGELSFEGEGALPSAYPVTDLASAVIAVAGAAVSELCGEALGERPRVRVDRRLASFWFGWSLRPIGWKLRGGWDAIAGDYLASDGWVRLHTNAPHHRAAAQRVLGDHDDREAMAAAVARWRKGELEAAVVEAGGCAAEMRTAQAWAEHPSGRAVASEPLVEIRWRPEGKPAAPPTRVDRPLAGMRVLDLTRVLAGPVATRFLAGFGAEVLRIDAPWWDEPAVAPEVALGKRCARLDLTKREDRATFERLLADADVLVHGYRAAALERLGYDETARWRLSPGLVDISLNAYGWSGPWRDRRGFDSLVQMSAGVADTGMRWKAADQPVPLPVQALDHATGYLMAAAAVRGLAERRRSGRALAARLSLARTATLLAAHPPTDSGALAPETPADRAEAVEETAWGPAQRLVSAVQVGGAGLRWDIPAAPFGSSPPAWRVGQC